MKKYLFIILSLLCFMRAQAQYVLPVPVTYQEQNEWCWAGCTACIFHYFGDTIHQCEIADYTRTVSTWHYFGSVPCCTDPAFGCNSPNIDYGAGSIADILDHFAGISDYPMGPLSLAQMDSCAAHYLPFIIDWSWVSGSSGVGHVVVGNGVDTASNVHYMDPWPGEGAHICTHTWMMYDGLHTYMRTHILSNCPLTVNSGSISGPSTVLAGADITLTDTATGGTWHCSNAHATVSAAGVVTGVSAGWDTVMYTVSNACGTATASWPVHITAPVSSGTNMVGAIADGLAIYPNPNKGSFSVKLTDRFDEPVRISITNMVGRQALDVSAKTNELINISLEQPAGIYMLMATTAHGTYTSKVVLDK